MKTDNSIVIISVKMYFYQKMGPLRRQICDIPTLVYFSDSVYFGDFWNLKL